MPATAVPTYTDDFLNRNGAVQYTNLVGNPSAETNSNGFSVYSQTGTGTPGRVADTSFGSGFAFQALFTGATVAGSAYATPSPSTINTFTADPAKRYAVRLRAKVQSVSGGTISSMILTLTNCGFPTPQGGGQLVGNPVTGTVYDLFGYVNGSTIIANGGLVTGFEIDFAFTGTVAADIRIDQIMICEIPTTQTTIPPYFDGASFFSDWLGTPNASQSVTFNSSTNGFSPDWTFELGQNNIWAGYANYQASGFITSGYVKNDGTRAFSGAYNNAVNPCQDIQMSMKLVFGDVTQNGQATLRYRVDGANELQFYLGREAAPGNQGFILRMNKVVGGVTTGLASNGFSFAVPASGTAAWITASLQGTVATFYYWTTDPTLPTSTPAQSIIYTLTGSDITTFGAGVKGRPAFYWVPTDKAMLLDRLDFFELTKQRSVTRNTKLGTERVSRVILPLQTPKLLVMYNAGGASDAFWQGQGYNVTNDTSGNQLKTDIIAKVLAGGYTHFAIDWGYAAAGTDAFDAAYTLYNTYGINVFTGGNDSVWYPQNPIWTGAVTASGALRPTVPALVRHPITDMWKSENPQIDGDGNTYLTGVRSSAVVVGEWFDPQGNRRPAIIAEENPNGNGARYIHMEPYNWGAFTQLAQAIGSWFKPNGKLRQADAIYGDTDTYLTEAEVTQLKNMGFTIFDGNYPADYLNFRRYIRNGPAGALPLDSIAS